MSKQKHQFARFESLLLSNQRLDASSFEDQLLKDLASATEEADEVTEIYYDREGDKDNTILEFFLSILHHVAFKKITKLYFSSELNEEQVELLSHAHLPSNITALQFGQGSLVEEAHIEAVCSRLPLKLESFELSCLEQVSLEAFRLICQCLKTADCKLSHLALPFCGLDSDSVNELCEAIKHPNCKLVELDVSNNKIGRKNVCELARSVIWSQTLKELNVEYTFYEDDVTDNSFSDMSSLDDVQEMAAVRDEKADEVRAHIQFCFSVRDCLIPVYILLAARKGKWSSRLPEEIVKRICCVNYPDLGFRKMKGKGGINNDHEDEEGDVDDVEEEIFEEEEED